MRGSSTRSGRPEVEVGGGWGRGEPRSSTDSDTGAAGCTEEPPRLVAAGRHQAGGGRGAELVDFNCSPPLPPGDHPLPRPALAPGQCSRQPPPPGPRLIAPGLHRVGWAGRGR